MSRLLYNLIVEVSRCMILTEDCVLLVVVDDVGIVVVVVSGGLDSSDSFLEIRK